MYRNMESSGPNLVSPGHIFYKPVQLEVPDFQRPYVWNKEDQWEPLWWDVTGMAEWGLENTDAENNQKHHHFMGAIALQQRPNATSEIETRIIVDGQQRLITLQLLINAIKLVYEQKGYNLPVARLSKLVTNEDIYWNNNPDDAFKVWPSVYDRTAFRHAMTNQPPNGQAEKSSIGLAHNYFKTITEGWLQRFNEGQERTDAVAALEKVVTHYLELAVIDLRAIDDPHVIFETLNARGTPLLPSDMIKNQILYKAGIQEEYNEDPPSADAKSLWDFDNDWWRTEIGRGNQQRPRIDTYLNHWLTLRSNEETKSRDEFRVFSEYVEKSGQTGTTIRKIADDIGKLGTIYQKIEGNEWEGIETFLYRRQIMGIGGMIPVLLWLLSTQVKPQELSTSLKALESYIVRRMVCGLGAQSYGQFFASLAGHLAQADSGAAKAGELVISYLSRQNANATKWPDDDTVLETFRRDPLYSTMSSQRLNLILQGIEGEMRTHLAETLAVPRRLQIEHIMPQDWSTSWPLPTRPGQRQAEKEKLAETRNRVVHTIGNLTLVNNRLNPTLSNAPWQTKKETLKNHSTLFLNKNLVDNAPKNWDEAAIEARGETLHKLTIKVWPHAKSMT